METGTAMDTAGALGAVYGPTIIVAADGATVDATPKCRARRNGWHASIVASPSVEA